MDINLSGFFGGHRFAASLLMASLAALFAGCQEDGETSDAGAPAGDAEACNGDGSILDCSVDQPDSALPFGNGIAVEFVGNDDQRLESLVFGADTGQTIGAWVGGMGVDGMGCPFNFTTNVVQDGQVLKLQVWHEFATDRGCGDYTPARTAVEFPPLSAGDYSVRLQTGGCTDRGCGNEVQGPAYIDIPLSVVP